MNVFATISGGGIRFLSQLSTFIELVESGIRPKKSAGVSAGAIVILLYFADKLDQGLDIGRMTHDINIISSRFNRLYNSDFKISKFAILKLLLGKNYLSKMDNLKKNIQKLISEEDWVLAKGKNSDLDCYIHCVEEGTHRKISFNLKDLTRNEAINWVIASCSVAPFVPSVKVTIKGVEYNVVDGGHRDPSAGSFLTEESGIIKPSDFDECISIWSREDINSYNVSSGEKIGTFIERTINAVSMSQREVSINDEQKELKFCKEHGKIYSPLYVRTKVETPYNMTEQQAIDAELEGRRVAQVYLNR